MNGAELFDLFILFFSLNLTLFNDPSVDFYLVDIDCYLLLEWLIVDCILNIEKWVNTTLQYWNAKIYKYLDRTDDIKPAQVLKPRKQAPLSPFFFLFFSITKLWENVENKIGKHYHFETHMTKISSRNKNSSNWGVLSPGNLESSTVQWCSECFNQSNMDSSMKRLAVEAIHNSVDGRVAASDRKSDGSPSVWVRRTQFWLKFRFVGSEQNLVLKNRSDPINRRIMCMHKSMHKLIK